MNLKDNEVICPECNGEKYNETNYTQYYTTHKLCPKCQGKGKLDWIDNMLNRNILEFDTFEHISIYKISTTDPIISYECVL